MIKLAWAYVTGNAKMFIIGAVLLSVVGIYTYHKVKVWQSYRAGYGAAVADINKAAAKLKLETGVIVRKLGISECYDKGEAWVWNRDTGKCVKL